MSTRDLVGELRLFLEPFRLALYWEFNEEQSRKRFIKALDAAMRGAAGGEGIGPSGFCASRLKALASREEAGPAEASLMGLLRSVVNRDPLVAAEERRSALAELHALLEPIQACLAASGGGATPRPRPAPAAAAGAVSQGSRRVADFSLFEFGPGPRDAAALAFLERSAGLPVLLPPSSLAPGRLEAFRDLRSLLAEKYRERVEGILCLGSASEAEAALSALAEGRGRIAAGLSALRLGGRRSSAPGELERLRARLGERGVELAAVIVDARPGAEQALPLARIEQEAAEAALPVMALRREPEARGSGLELFPIRPGLLAILRDGGRRMCLEPLSLGREPSILDFPPILGYLEAEAAEGRDPSRYDGIWGYP